MCKQGNSFAPGSRIFLCTEKDKIDEFFPLLQQALDIKDIYNYYEINQPLGTGQFGVVYLGTSLNNDDKVAIKIINKQSLSLTEIQQLHREVDIHQFLKCYDHPNIIKMIEVYEDHKSVYLVMEYLEGGSLQNYVNRRGRVLNDNDASLVSKQIIHGLEFLNDVGIVHRDIKPENILLVKKNDLSAIKIIDFGLSTVLSKSETTNESYGTLLYSAPEVLLRTPYNNKIDVWSLGIVVYHLTTGGFPFDSNNHVDKYEIQRKICRETPRIPESFSNEIKQFIRLCLIKEKSIRTDIKELKTCNWLKK